MASIDSEQLSLYVRLQVVNPLDANNWWWLVVMEWSRLDHPFVELLELDVQAGVWILCGNDTVDRGICISCSLVVVFQSVFRGVVGVLDMLGESVRCADGVFACDHGDRGGVVGPGIDSFCDDGSKEPEDVGADGAGYEICRRDLGDDVCF